jgi:hypothetical protein
MIYRDISLTVTSIPIPRPTHPVLYVPGAFSPGVKRHGREADPSLPPSAEVKNGGAIHGRPMRLHSAMFNS